MLIYTKKTKLTILLEHEGACSMRRKDLHFWKENFMTLGFLFYIVLFLCLFVCLFAVYFFLFIYFVYVSHCCHNYI